MDLILQKHAGVADKTDLGGGIMIGTAGNGDYWTYRVAVSDTQAVIGFPKFGTIGVGFEVEDDWNTNLPYQSGASAIFKHILHNKGDDSISDDTVFAAILLIVDAAHSDRDEAGR